MALIECPDCRKQVSDAAPACPGCGRPINAAARDPREIEQTGKHYKRAQILAVLFFCFGLFLTISGVNQDANGVALAGGLLLFASIIVMIYAKAGAWWHNG